MAPGMMVPQCRLVPAMKRYRLARASVLIANATTIDRARTTKSVQWVGGLTENSESTHEKKPLVTVASREPMMRAAPKITAASRSRAFSSTKLRVS